MGCLIAGVILLFLAPIFITTGLLKVVLGGVLWLLLLPLRLLHLFF